MDGETILAFVFAILLLLLVGSLLIYFIIYPLVSEIVEWEFGRVSSLTSFSAMEKTRLSIAKSQQDVQAIRKRIEEQVAAMQRTTAEQVEEMRQTTRQRFEAMMNAANFAEYSFTTLPAMPSSDTTLPLTELEKALWKTLQENPKDQATRAALYDYLVDAKRQREADALFPVPNKPT